MFARVDRSCLDRHGLERWNSISTHGGCGAGRPTMTLPAHLAQQKVEPSPVSLHPSGLKPSEQLKHYWEMKPLLENRIHLFTGNWGGGDRWEDGGGGSEEKWVIAKKKIKERNHKMFLHHCSLNAQFKNCNYEPVFSLPKKMQWHRSTCCTSESKTLRHISPNI